MSILKKEKMSLETASKSIYKRVLLKLSGEALMGDQKFGVEHRSCLQIAHSIKEVHELGLQMGIVVGGGNIFRGNQAEAFGFARTPADHIGMLATTINGLVLQQTLASLGVESRVMSALNTDFIVEPFHWGHALHSLQKGMIIQAYGMVNNSDPAARFLSEYYNKDDKKNSPFIRAGQVTVHPQIKSVMARTENIWEIEWIEETRDRKGNIIGKESMKALLTVYYISPESEQALMANPMGIFIKDITWSEIQL